MVDILSEFEQRIAANKREIEEQEHALAVLRRTMNKPLPSSALPVEAKGKTDVINFDDLVKSTNKNKKEILANEVKETVSLFGENEFTLAHIEAALNKRGVKIDAKQPRARINAALIGIVEDGFVTRVFEGAGNVPHRYKLAS